MNKPVFNQARSVCARVSARNHSLEPRGQCQSNLLCLWYLHRGKVGVEREECCGWGAKRGVWWWGEVKLMEQLTQPLY